jgi:hypothetical protein
MLRTSDRQKIGQLLYLRAVTPLWLHAAHRPLWAGCRAERVTTTTSPLRGGCHADRNLDAATNSVRGTTFCIESEREGRVYMPLGCGIEYVGSPPPAFSVPGSTSTPFLITMWSAVLAGMTPPSGCEGMPTVNEGAEATAFSVPTAAAVALARFASIAPAEPRARHCQRPHCASCTGRGG